MEGRRGLANVRTRLHIVKEQTPIKSQAYMKTRQLMQTAVLAAVLCSRTAFPANISQSDLYNYVRTTWNVTSLSDDAIQALLDQAPSDTIYGGIPYKNLIGVMIEAPRMYDALSQGDYRAAGQVALEYGQDALFDGAMEWLGLASISAPVEAAAWPINAGLTAFADAVKKNAFRTHCLLYFAARNAGNTYDAIVSVNARGGLLDADPSIVQQGLLTETDDGWLYTSQGAYGPTSVPGYTSAQFYEFAETLYQCQRARSTFANDRSNLRQAFLSDAYPQAPTIYQQPRGGSYAQGGSLLLTVGASGQQPLHYQWFRNGASISGATTSSYRVQSPDDGDYQVQVTDASSLTTSSETVTVDLLPTGASVVISAPANNSTLAGTAVVRVTAPAATRVEFYLDGVLQVTDNSGPFSWSWNTATADNGQSTLSARAYNGSTLLATSAGVHVTVDNPDSGSCLDTNEPNNSSLSAALLPLGTANAGFICTPSDVDWFRILVDRPGMLTVTLSVPAGKDFELELYGPNALWVDGSYNPPGENERIDFPAQQAGTYWARTYGYPIGSGSFSADQPYEIVAGLGDPVASGTNSGIIGQNVIWSGVVDLSGDVTIIGGGSLTILPGTLVRCASGDDRSSGNDSSRVEIILNGGTLNASGTMDAPIRFTSRAQNPLPGNWYGIRILDGDVTVRNCVVEYAVEGIRFEDGDTRFNSYTLSDVTVQRCTGNGVFTTGGSYVVPVVLNNFQLLTNGTGLNANGPVEFRGGRAEGNAGNGISANNAALVVTGVLVKLNGSSGIDAGYSTTVTLTDCTLSFNRGHGIEARWATLQMQNCTVTRNDSWGIYWNYWDSRERQVEIWNSMIQSNASGVFLSGNLMVGVVSNTITDNGGTGLQLSLYGGGVSTSGITGNVIRRQDVGVRVAGSGPSLLTLSANDFYQNTSFELRNESAFAVIANGNYWGDPTTTELAQSKANLSRIYDIRDGASQQVLINQWYAAPLSGGSPGSPHNFDYTVPGTTAVVSGEVSDSQTWSGKVVVIGDVTIIGGGSLTIQPGTEVLFDALHDTQASGNDLSRCELIVQGGTLLVDGTAGSPVKLSSGGLNKAPGDWYGVRILDGDVTVRSCVVEYAVEGIRFEDTDTRFSSYTLSDVTVQRCTGNGVFTTGGTYVVPVVLNNFQLLTNGTGLNANGPVEFRGGRAEGNNANGIVANNTALAVTGTLVKLNGSSGIDAGYGTTVTLTDCILSFNRGNGIQARWASLQMQGCTVMRNDNWGIYWMYYDSRGRQVEIWNSMIQSNASGVFLSGNLMVGVVSNTITDNGATGLQLSLYGGGVSTSGVTGNVIRRQDVGVSVSGSAPSLLTLSGNDFYQNTSFELRNDTGISITANDCYWGEPTTTEWAAGQVNLSRIYDLQDNASYGQVLIQSIRGTAALQPPRFTTQPQGVTALPGDTVTLSADASGSVPISFQWYRNGATVAEATDPDLTLPSLDASKAGNYFVVAANAVGRATSFVAQVTLIVPPAPPVIVQHPVSQTVALGGSVSFAVAATGTGPFTYQWRKNGAPIPGATAATLSIPFVAVSDAAEYTVTVTNPGGNATSQPATLTLNTSGGTAVTRQITRAGTNFFVTVTVIPPVGTPAYLVEEFIPTNFSVFNISGSGSLDAPNGRVVWGPFWDGLTRALTYTLIPPPGFTGTATLNGAALFFGATAATSGDNTIRMTPTNPTTLAISEFYGYFMITINGTVGSTYRLEVAGDPSGPWEPLELVTLPRSPWPYVDWDSAGQTNRFYRSVLVE